MIVTNIDFDHPDYFTGIDDVFDAFQEMAAQVKTALISFGDDDYLRKLKVDVPVLYYGFNDNNDFQAKNLSRTPQGSAFDVYYKGEFLEHFVIPSFGKHNVLNALGVIALCVLEDFIIDDYAHHPAEISATLDAAHQKYPDKEIIAVFQPHTFTRTVALLSEFAEALNFADTVYLCDIFTSAREKEGDITIKDLAVKVEQGAVVLSEDNVSPLLKHKNAVMIFMGAGDVQKFEQSYEKLLNHSTKRLV